MERENTYTVEGGGAGGRFQDGEQVRVLSDAELVAVAQIRSLTPQAVLAPVRVFGISEQ